MLTIPTGWPIATRPAVVLGSGRKSSFSTCWTWPLSTVTSFHLHAVGKKFHIEIFDSVREMLARSGYEPRPSKPVGRPAQTSTNIGRLNTRHNQHWPNGGKTQRRCRVCSARGVKRCVRSVCVDCNVALCVDRNCFMDYHTEDKL